MKRPRPPYSRGWVCLALAYSPIVDADGNVTGVSIFVHDVSAQRRAAQTIQSIVKGTAAALGEAFFRSLARELAAAVGTRYALVGELIEGEPPQIRTVAVSGDSGILDNFDYDLSHTPRAGVIQDGIQSARPTSSTRSSVRWPLRGWTRAIWNWRSPRA